MSKRRYVSPLRYPGGKARMAPFLAEMFAVQTSFLDVEIWIEPFAGGAGAGLTLLDRGAVDEVWLTEKHPAIAAMWRSVLLEGGGTCPPCGEDVRRHGAVGVGPRASDCRASGGEA